MDSVNATFSAMSKIPPQPGKAMREHSNSDAWSPLPGQTRRAHQHPSARNLCPKCRTCPR